jgi:hypothetical protein
MFKPSAADVLRRPTKADLCPSPLQKNKKQQVLESLLFHIFNSLNQNDISMRLGATLLFI